MSISVLDATGTPTTVETLPSVAQKASASSLPVVLSTEQQAIIDAQSASATFFAITPSDSVDFTIVPKSVYVGVTGNITAKNAAGVSVLFTAVPAGTTLPIKPTRIMATGTTASALVAY